MALEKITQITGRAVCVAGDDIDTDRIIPARFMRCVTFDGLGAYLFYDVRFDANDTSRNHPLDHPDRKGATILISGENFGCGSSREHAPQALRKFGIRAVIAGSFAEIFFGNSTGLGMPCVSVEKSDREKIVEAIQADPKLEPTIDLAAQQIRFGLQQVPCTIRKSARKALMEGQWDPIGQLLEGRDAVAKLAAALPY